MPVFPSGCMRSHGPTHWKSKFTMFTDVHQTCRRLTWALEVAPNASARAPAWHPCQRGRCEGAHLSPAHGQNDRPTQGCAHSSRRNVRPPVPDSWTYGAASQPISFQLVVTEVNLRIVSTPPAFGLPPRLLSYAHVSTAVPADASGSTSPTSSCTVLLTRRSTGQARICSGA